MEEPLAINLNGDGYQLLSFKDKLFIGAVSVVLALVWAVLAFNFPYFVAAYLGCVVLLVRFFLKKTIKGS